MPDSAENWANQPRLNLWILGYHSPLLSVREVWRLTLSMAVILMTLAIGTIVAMTMTMSHLTSGDQTFYLQAPFILVPLLVTITSSSLISVAFYFRYHRHLRHGDMPEVITVPVTLAALVASTPFIVVFNGTKYLAGGLTLEAFLLVSAVSPFVYMLISDYIHFLILQYVAPTILGRPSIAPPERPGDTRLRKDRLGLLASLLRVTERSRVQKPKQGQANWRDTVCLSIWVSGKSTSLMSVRELWAVVFSPFVMALSVLIGSAAGVASTITLMAVGDETNLVLMLFAIAPVFVNIGSAAWMSLAVFLRLRRAKDGEIPTVSMPSAITIYVSAIPMIALIYGLKVATGGLGENWLGYVITVTPIAYVLISDFFHYVVFFFVTPSIWGREHLYEPISAEQAQPMPAPDDGDAAEPALPESTHEIRIGNTTIPERDLVFLEAQGNYLRVVTGTVEHLERFRISAAVDQLSDDLGVFLHRSYWVSYSGIDRVLFSQGQCKVKTTHGEVINVASTRQNDVIPVLKERGFISA